MSIKTQDLKESNTFVIGLIKKGKPFLITRVGIGSETINAYCHLKKETIDHGNIYRLENNAGVYNLDEEGRKKYAELYLDALENSSALAAFPTAVVKEQLAFIQKYKFPVIYSRVVEPFHCCRQKIVPWSMYLRNKKILIVSPFTDSIKSQNESGFKMFKNKPMFQDNQVFVYYKCYQTAAGNKPHKNWFETFEIICKDIEKLDFDIALLGCGGYGLPLANFIYKKLDKSAIYVGGGLQLLFGVMGRRWTTQENGVWLKIFKENDSKIIRPSGDEIPKNIDRVENGCYW